MKLPHTLAAIVIVTLPAWAIAAKDGKAGKGRPGRPQPAGELSEALKPFDKNGNRQIDGDELAAVQKAFSALGKLDKNANGEIEQGEVAAATPPAGRTRPDGVRARAAEGLKKVDTNGNHRIDPDEIAPLEKMLANGKGEMLKKLDQNSNGKLEESEIARLNERMAKGGAARRPGAKGAPTPNFRRPPEKPADTTKPAETIKPAEKTEKPADAAKFEDKKIEFGS
jgi:Ca2+-binding EF-hand superfamily protein